MRWQRSGLDLSQLHMLGNRVLLRALAADELGEQLGHIVLPPQAADHQRLLSGVVVAVGPDVSGDVLPGFRVQCSRFRRTPVDADGTLWVTTEDAIEAVWLDG